MYAYAYAHIYTRMYIYIYIYIHVHIYVNIHIYIYVCTCEGCSRACWTFTIRSSAFKQPLTRDHKMPVYEPDRPCQVGLAPWRRLWLHILRQCKTPFGTSLPKCPSTRKLRDCHVPRLMRHSPNLWAAGQQCCQNAFQRGRWNHNGRCCTRNPALLDPDPPR